MVLTHDGPMSIAVADGLTRIGESLGTIFPPTALRPSYTA
jgi:hypothetical protein